MNTFINLFIALFLSLSQYSFGQIYNTPNCNSQVEENLKIVRVIRTENSTTIDFVYTHNKTISNYIFLNPPYSAGAYYIKADGKIYMLISTRGIGNTDKITTAFQNIPVSFSATFEPIPNYVTEFDLIEGSLTGTWHFYGIQLKANTGGDQCDYIEIVRKSSKPDFKSLLTGVNKAVIMSIDFLADATPSNALVEYLQALGFSNIKFMNENSEPPINLCEEIWVELKYDKKFYLDYDTYSNIKLIFHSKPTGYSWEFPTDKVVKTSNTPQYNFGIIFRSMYGYTKGVFNSSYTMKLPKMQTCWTEASLRSSFSEKGRDVIEGVYENTASSARESKYRIGVRKIDGIYYLLYFSGAPNYADWSAGEIKAKLESTATPHLFKAIWLMADKSENQNYYIEFAPAYFNLISDESEKQMYIKMF